MDEFVKLLNTALNYVGHRVEEQKCVIIVESNRKEVTCPNNRLENQRLRVSLYVGPIFFLAFLFCYT